MIALIGEALVDVIDGKPYPGGCQFNSCLASSRFSVPTIFMDNISLDSYGSLILSRLRGDRVIVPTAFLSDPRPTMKSTVKLDSQGKACYEFVTENTATLGLNAEVILKELEKIPYVEAVMVGSVSLVLEPAASAIIEAVTRYHKNHPETCIMLDPNIRASLITDKDRYMKALSRIIDICDIIKLSDEDLDFLKLDVKRLALSGCDVVITKGELGSTWYHQDRQISCKAYSVDVVDTVGAGDTFNGSLLKAIYQNRCKPNKFSEVECRKTLDLASRAASVNCSRRGCDPPRMEELL